MINQLRTDFYRLSHTWGIYITLAVTIVYSLIINLQQVVGGIMVTSMSSNAMSRLSTKEWSIKDGVNASTLSSSILMYFFISIFVITIGYEFSQKTYKNTLVSGITRSQFILSKYLVMLLNIFVMILVYFFTSIVSGLITNRSVGASWGKLLPMSLNVSIVIAFFISVIFGLAILILILTSSIVISSIFIVVFPIFISVLSIFTSWDWLKYVDFFSAAIKISVKAIPNDQLWEYVVTSLIVWLVTIAASIFLIRNKEL